MKVDLDELRKRIDLELKEMEQQEALLKQQIEHLVVVQKLVETEPPGATKSEGLHISDFRQALFGTRG